MEMQDERKSQKEWENNTISDSAGRGVAGKDKFKEVWRVKGYAMLLSKTYDSN